MTLIWIQMDSHFFFSFFPRQLWDEFSVVKRSPLSGLSLPIFDWSVIALNRPKETFQGRGAQGVQGAMVPPRFWRSVNPISNRGWAYYAHHITTVSPPHCDLNGVLRGHFQGIKTLQWNKSLKSFMSIFEVPDWPLVKGMSGNS